ncbi:MAG TPA: exonuclease domain-containing protein, partial [Acidobacteriota bacterium]|nr:exonuclease domain-containing protein [Acidobacteriota bacterium]
MFDQPLAIVDVETTGATPSHDRVTEIGILRVEKGCIIDEWSSLVNPETRIPPAIETLTGITNAMVAQAPTFRELADEILARLQGRLLVAHNARFDYGFIKNELCRLGVEFTPKLLCTVRLSRKLYPGYSHHNLDAIIERYGLNCAARHRALGDVRILWQFLQKIGAENDPADLAVAVRSQTKRPNLPAGLDASALDEIPEVPGVYLFYGANGLPLYVGKSVNLRSRVLSHFCGDHRSGQDMKIAQQVTRVDYFETAGPLGALIKEALLVKKLMPIHNRRLRGQHDLWTFRINANPKSVRGISLVNGQSFDARCLHNLYGLFKTKRDATKTLRELAAESLLCLKRLGLEKGQGPCFAYQLKRCKGCCVGAETRLAHDVRLIEAFASLKIKVWPFKGKIGIREKHAPTGREDIHVFNHWCYLGTMPVESSLPDFSEYQQDLAFDADTYKILLRFLAQKRNLGR